MKRLLAFVSVAVLGLLAGALVSGRPEDVKRDIRAVDIPMSTATTTTPTTTTSTTTTTTTLPTTTTSATTTLLPTTTASTTSTTTTSTTAASTEPETTEVATTEPATTDAAAGAASPDGGVSDYLLGAQSATTTEPTTTVQPTTTTTTTTIVTTTTTTLVPVADVVVLVANASNTYMLATRTNEVLIAIGYVYVFRTDGVRELTESMIYHAPGHAGEATRLAEQIGMASDRIAEVPAEPLVESGDDYELLLLLGNDWQEVSTLDTLGID